jgi:hypothetical protein
LGIWVFGYLGGDTSITNKLKWNAADWMARIKGKFRNECGAHAGYSATELEEILLGHFSTARNVSSNYNRHSSILNVIEVIRANTFVFPSVYFLGDR